MSATPSETFRIEAFADAVFAIAITLLVIEIRLPPHEEVLRIGGVGPALLQLWPSYVGYAISFIVIVQAIEFLVLKPIEMRVNRWRR